MKIGYIICTASGWYWSAFLEEGRDDYKNWFMNANYTIYSSRQAAVDRLDFAYSKHNATPVHLEVKKIFYK